MNKLICKYHKSKGTFKRNMCAICAYISRCQDHLEYSQGHNDDLRELSQKGEER